MKSLNLFLILVSTLFCLASNAMGTLEVTEVMADEPESYTSLEWIEIYNNSPNIVFLGPYPLKVMNDTIILPGALGAYDYAIVCRKLYADGGTPAFEEVWGNNDGVWGDDPLENYDLPIEISFPPLVNSGGEVTFLNGLGQPISQFVWPGSVGDGISWERENLGQPTIAGSVDPRGGTPGSINSITPLGHDLDLQRVTALRVDGATEISFEIKSRSLSYVVGGQLSIFRRNLSDSTDRTDVIRTVNLSGFDPGEVMVITEQFLMGGAYSFLGATLDDDDRVSNNVKLFTAPGAEFPSVILTEVMAAPKSLLLSEWVELYNRDDTSVDLSGWLLGDAIELDSISSASLEIAPGEYLVLAEDTADFRAYYVDPLIRLVEPVGWSALNNGGDIVRLVDPHGLEAARFEYGDVFDSNFTWSRAGIDIDADDWGRSLDPGGTPGAENVVLLDPAGSTVNLQMVPPVFSPDGDGMDDQTAIHVTLPAAESYTLKVYDRQGREVRTFLDGDRLINPDDVDPESSIWYFDGMDDNGKRLPIGIYVVYFEATGLESVKGSVVIAR